MHSQYFGIRKKGGQKGGTAASGAPPVVEAEVVPEEGGDEEAKDFATQGERDAYDANKLTVPDRPERLADLK